MPEKNRNKPARGTNISAPLSPMSGHPTTTSPRSHARSVDTPAHVHDDDDAADVFYCSPNLQPLSRRPTFDSSRRTVSPPNSVKAFAQARRRGQEHRQESDNEDDDGDGDGDFARGERPLGSTRSCHSRSHDARAHQRNSAATTDADKQQSAPKGSKERLYIDFACLETLIDEAGGTRGPSPEFRNLPDSSIPNNVLMFTADGDFIDVVADRVSISQEKEGSHSSRSRIRAGEQHQHLEQSRFNFFSSALESTIHAGEFGDLVLPGDHIGSLFDFPEGDEDGVWWLNMNNPKGVEVWTICKAFGIHPLTIEDIIHQESREKIELFPSYYFACFRSFATDQEPEGVDFHPFNVYAVVFREGIISFSFTPNAHASRVRFRISQLKEQVSLSSDWICYALIDDIVDSFGPGINQIEHETDAIEDQVFITRPEDNQAFLRRIGFTRKNVMSLMRLLGGKADVLRAFTKRCTEDYDVTPHMDIGLYLGDIQDHAVTMMNSLVHFDTMLSRSHSNYLAQLSIDNIDMGNRTNDVLSRVTVIATVIVPLNVVCGLFGMNVKVPWGDVENLNAFFGIMSGIILFALLSLLFARRMGYL